MNTTKAQIYSDIQKVENAIDEARGDWSGLMDWGASFFTGGVDDQAKGTLDNIEQVAFAAWKARGQDLANGVKRTMASGYDSLDRWTADGKELLKSIQDIGGLNEEVELDDILTDTAKATAVGAVEVVEDAVDYTKFVLPLVLVAVVGVALVVVLK